MSDSIKTITFLVPILRKNNEIVIWPEKSKMPTVVEKKELKKITFADRLKGINRTAIYRKINPDIEQWKKHQRQYFTTLKESVLRHFEYYANRGELKFCEYKNSFWYEKTKYIPNAEMLTREILEEIFEPYGIAVDWVEVTQDGWMTVCLIIQ